MRTKPPIPTELHKLRGSYNPTKHGRDRAGEPKPATALMPSPPPGLSKGERAEWEHQVTHFPRDVIRECDQHWLLTWCRAADRLNQASAILQREIAAHPEHPYQVEDSRGGWKLSPLIEVISRAELALSRATQELGFSPAARCRIHVTGTPGEPAAAPPAWGGKLAA
jgi:P27 family predicted phage terminase small subunit